MYNAVVTIKDTDTLMGVIVSLYKMGYNMDNVSVWNMADMCNLNKTVFLVNGHVSVGMVCDSRFDSEEMILKQQSEWVSEVAINSEYYSQRPFVDCGTDNVLFKIIAHCQHGDKKSIPHILQLKDGRERLCYIPENYDELSEDIKENFKEASSDYIREHLNDVSNDKISFRERLQ